MSDPWEARIQRASTSPTARKEMKAALVTKRSPLDINARRIKNGEPVGDMYLTGRLKQQLLEETDLTEADFAKYTG